MQLYDHGPELHLQRQVFEVAVLTLTTNQARAPALKKKENLYSGGRSGRPPPPGPCEAASRSESATVPHGTTTPRHRPTNPAVGRPVEQHRSADKGRARHDL